MSHSAGSERSEQLFVILLGTFWSFNRPNSPRMGKPQLFSKLVNFDNKDIDEFVCILAGVFDISNIQSPLLLLMLYLWTEVVLAGNFHKNSNLNHIRSNLTSFEKSWGFPILGELGWLEKIVENDPIKTGIVPHYSYQMTQYWPLSWVS